MLNFILYTLYFLLLQRQKLKSSSQSTNGNVAQQGSLVRAIGRWGLTAIVINSVIGSGIFGLPSAVAGQVGVLSPIAVLLSGLIIFIVVLCFAEVGSYFEDAGGPYLYTREAFGPAIGFQVGWLHIWTRLLSGAAALNILIAYLGLLIPLVNTPVGRTVTMTAAMLAVTAINIAGVRQASWAVSTFTVAKLLPLIILIIAGLLNIRQDVLATQVVAIPNWTEAVLLLVFAYGGFESSVIAASETRNPKADTAFALILGMIVITTVYCLVQFAVMGVLPNAAQSPASVASALGELLGTAGLTIGSIAVVISVSGWLMGFALMTPRILLSMAERYELPVFIARIHPRFRTPYAAIILNSLIALGLSLYSSFTQAATLSVIARIGIFGLTCASLIVLRKRSDMMPGFRLPGGRAIALAGIAFCIWLLATRNLTHLWILLFIMAAGALIRLFSRRMLSVR